MKSILSIFLEFYCFLYKDFMLFFKKKKFFYLTFLIPIIFACIFMSMIVLKNLDITIGVCQFDKSQDIEKIYNHLDFNIVFLEANSTCEKNLIENIEEENFELGILIEEDFSKKLENLKQSKIKIFFDNTDLSYSSLISWKVDSILNPAKYEITNSLNQKLKNEIIKIRPTLDFLKQNLNYNYLNGEYQKIETTIINLENLDTSYLIYPIYTEKIEIYESQKIDILLTYIFPIITMFIILMLSSIMFIHDRKSNFLLRVKLSSNIYLYVFSKIVFFTILTFIQFLLLYLIFSFLDLNITLNFLETLKLIILMGISMTLIGILIGTFSENEGISVLFSLVISLPQMLLCGLVFPLEIFNNFIRQIIYLFPLNIQIDITKDVLLFSKEIDNFLFLALLIIFLFVCFLVNKREI